MKFFYDPDHTRHAPAHEFYRGERVAAFETPARAESVLARLLACGHTAVDIEADCTPVLQRVHSPAYLDFLRTAWSQWLALDPANAGQQPFPSVWPIRSLRSDLVPDNFIARLGLYSMDNGTPLVEGTWDVAKRASDAAVSAVALLNAGERAAFCCIRPPGHHAGRDFMGGYCFLNHAAVAAEALRQSGAGRVAVLDVDFHHGNGTQAIFYERADVLFVSIHGDPRTEYPFYLGHAEEQGVGAGLGHNLNLPLAAGASVASWFDALDVAARRLRAQGLDALVVSLGLDTFGGDPIAKFHLQADDYLRLGERLAALALPTVLVLEGGYASAALGVNAVNVLEGFEHHG